MARLIGSHPSVALPTHENKIIVEAFGLRDLVERLEGRWYQYGHMEAVRAFSERANALRWTGFNNPNLNALSNLVGRLAGRKGLERHVLLRRLLPKAKFTWHGSGEYFGLKHYQKCIDEFIAELLEASPAIEGSGRTFRYPKKLTRLQLIEAAREFLGKLYAPTVDAKGAATWCDDTPANFLYLDFLLEIFPEMKFVHMVRDPRDVISSYGDQVWARGNPSDFARMLKRHIDEYTKLKAIVPADSILEVRLEDLVSNQGETIGRLAEFLKLEDQFDRTLVKGSISHMGRHRNDLNGADEALVLRELGDWMKAHEYIE